MWLQKKSLRPAGLAIALAVLLLLAGCQGSGVQSASSVYFSSETGESRAIGFGAGARGGSGGSTRYVESLADSGPGSLREAAGLPGVAKVKFSVSGVIRLLDEIEVSSDKTIDGTGADITIENQGLRLMGVSNIIIKNLKFQNIVGETDDAIQIKDGSKDIWIDHCSFRTGQDGLVDVTRGATAVTISWSKFSEHDKTILISGELTEVTPQVTLHHNFFLGTIERNPLLTEADAHAFNNYLLGWLTFGMKANEESELASESNVFRAAQNKKAILVKEPRLGAARSTRDALQNGATVVQRDPDLVFKPSRFYSYTPESAGSRLAKKVQSGAGWQAPQN